MAGEQSIQAPLPLNVYRVVIHTCAQLNRAGEKGNIFAGYLLIFLWQDNVPPYETTRLLPSCTEDADR